MAFVLGLDAIIAGLGDVRQLVGSEHSQFIFDHDLANYAQASIFTRRLKKPRF